MLSLSPLWPPVAGDGALQAAARVSLVAEDRPLDLVTGPAPDTGEPTAPAPVPPARTHALPAGTVGEQVAAAWAQIGQWVSGDWDYALVCSGPGDPWAHLVAASQKLLHPQTPWQAHLVAPARWHGRRRGLLPGPVRDSIRGAAAERDIELPDTNPADWAELLVSALADEIVCASERLAEHYRQTSTNPGARHTVWQGSPWPDLVPVPVRAGRPPLDLVLCEPEDGTAASVLETALELAPDRIRDAVALHVLEPTDAHTRAGLERALGADVLVLADPPPRTDPSGGLVAPYPAGLLLDHPEAPTTWLIAHDGTDLDGRPSVHRSPADHPTGALVVLDRLTRGAAARG